MIATCKLPIVIRTSPRGLVFFVFAAVGWCGIAPMTVSRRRNSSDRRSFGRTRAAASHLSSQRLRSARASGTGITLESLKTGH